MPEWILMLPYTDESVQDQRDAVWGRDTPHLDRNNNTQLYREEEYLHCYAGTDVTRYLYQHSHQDNRKYFYHFTNVPLEMLN
jgi:hypothetical protein